MIRNYLKIALRNLTRHKTFSVINIFGLALGMTSAIMILLYIQDELNFDRFHSKSDRIYRVVEKRTSPGRGERWVPQTALAFAPSLRTEFPQIEDAVRCLRIGRFAVTHGTQRFYEGNYLFTEPDFFRVFDFPILQGDAATALTDPRSAVLTRSEAIKYFGSENPVGQTIQVERFGDLKVTAVLKDLPTNSHLQFSMLFSLSTLEAANPRFAERLKSWNSGESITYAALRTGSDAGEIERQLTQYLADHVSGSASEQRRIGLQALTDIHFKSDQMEFDRNANKASVTNLYILAVIGMMILAIAVFNYINLATGRAAKRSKEVGMRKVVGASRGQLAVQFISEAVLLACFALFAASVAVELLLPSFNEFTGKSLTLSMSTPVQWLGIVFLALSVGMLSGAYPAVIVSRLQPALILKDTAGGVAGKIWMRRVLVVAQFIISIALIAGTLVIYRQMQFIENKNLGFEEDNLLVIDINSGNARRNFKTMKSEFAQLAAVRSVSVSSRVPGEWKDIVRAEFTSESSVELKTMYYMGVDEDFLDVYRMKLLDGQDFSKDFAPDSAGVLINEAAAKVLGVDGAVGKIVTAASIMDGGTKESVRFSFRIKGIVKDFNFQSLHEAVAPIILGNWNNPIQAIDYFTLRIQTKEPEETLKRLEVINRKFDPDHPFEFNFLDVQLQRFYESEIRMRSLFTAAASLAIGVACLGLFGLVSYVTERRTKEIGVRKTLGATTGRITFMLLQDFLKLIIAAFVIGCPIAAYVMNRWLENFAFRIELDWTIFAIAGGATLTITLLTMGYQALKAATANPVEALKYE